MKKGNVLILAIAATALLGGSAWLYLFFLFSEFLFG